MKFAFAVNLENTFEAKHFGDADKYMIYEYINDDFLFVSEQKNEFIDFDEEQAHGSFKKGNAIISSLKESEVKVLVSKQFGRNIKMVNQHFVPVIISGGTIEDVLFVLKEHIQWITDERKNNTEDFNLYIIKNGVLRRSIRKERKE